jgi:NADP-dependent 3-hydroxy acid dehydrogenase YdfG
LEEVVKYVNDFNGDLSLLVHNAGTASVGKISEFSIKNWNATLSLNLTTPFKLTKKLLPQMKKGGQFIFINSVAGKSVFPGWAAYSASKFGLKAFADTLREEVSPKKIKVTTIFPAAVDTSLHDEMPYDWDRTKMLKPSDVAKAVLYCLRQPANIIVKDLDLESISGTF